MIVVEVPQLSTREQQRNSFCQELKEAHACVFALYPEFLRVQTLVLHMQYVSY